MLLRTLWAALMLASVAWLLAALAAVLGGLLS